MENRGEEPPSTPKKQISKCGNEVDFNPLREPEPLFTIQVDTPQPTLMSSPRTGVNPRSTLIDDRCQALSPAHLNYHNYSYESNQSTLSLTNSIPSSAGYAYGMPTRPQSSHQNQWSTATQLPFYWGHCQEFMFLREHVLAQPRGRPTSSSSRPGSFYSLVEGRHLMSFFSMRPGSRPASRPESRPTSHMYRPMSRETQYGVRNQAPNSVQSFGYTPLNHASTNPIIADPIVEQFGETPVRRKRGRPPKVRRTPDTIPTPKQPPVVRVKGTPKIPRGTMRTTPTPKHKRSRGCWTCKCRRKKCDETKPSCTMCEKLNLPCLGYSGEKPECMSTPEKSEQTRSLFTSQTKKNKDATSYRCSPKESELSLGSLKPESTKTLESLVPVKSDEFHQNCAEN